MKGVLFSKAAVADLDDIDAYTLQNFGLGQAVKLRQEFERVVALLLQSPLMAPGRAAYDPPGKTFRYYPGPKSFVTVYEPVESGIRIARILHGARDLSSELQRESGKD